MTVSRCIHVRGNFFFFWGGATFYPWGKGVILVKSVLFTNWPCVASALGQCFHSVSQTFLLIQFQQEERYTSSNYLMEEGWESTDNPTEKFQSPGTGGKMRQEKRQWEVVGRGRAWERMPPALTPRGPVSRTWTAFTTTPVSFFQDGKRGTVPFEGEAGRRVSPAARPTSPGVQALSRPPHSGEQETTLPVVALETSSVMPSALGLSPEAPNAQRVTVSTGWKGAGRPQNGIWVLFFKEPCPSHIWICIWHLFCPALSLLKVAGPFPRVADVSSCLWLWFHTFEGLYRNQRANLHNSRLSYFWVFLSWGSTCKKPERGEVERSLSYEIEKDFHFCCLTLQLTFKKYSEVVTLAYLLPFQHSLNFP